MRIFWKKTVKVVSVLGAPPPNPHLPPEAVGELLPTITTLSSSFLVLNAFYFAGKEPSNYYKGSAFASSALLLLFFNSICYKGHRVWISGSLREYELLQ